MSCSQHLWIKIFLLTSFFLLLTFVILILFRHNLDTTTGQKIMPVWILCDLKHVGVIFNVCLLDFYVTEILMSLTVIIECISWLINVMYITIICECLNRVEWNLFVDIVQCNKKIIGWQKTSNKSFRLLHFHKWQQGLKYSAVCVTTCIFITAVCTLCFFLMLLKALS
jgi:hypothetical protein